LFVKYLVVFAEGGVELFYVRELVAGATLRAGAKRGDGKLLVLLSSNREVKQWNRIYPFIQWSKVCYYGGTVPLPVPYLKKCKTKFIQNQTVEPDGA
jgi:hypothetical protein